MYKRHVLVLSVVGLGMLFLASPPDGLGQPDPKGDFGRKGGFGPGGPMKQTRAIVKDFDKDGDGRLNAGERKVARESLQRTGGGFGRGPGGKMGFGRGNQEPPKPGPKVKTADVTAYPDRPLYEPTILRTLFLQFETDDWEAELQDFNNTDVEVPCTLTVDGQTYPGVGVHFRGMSSYMAIPTGGKRSLNLSLDFVDPKQRLYGYKALNLLNSHGDPSFLNTVLYSHIARKHIPGPKANLVKVVINGESWGVYSSAQQFDKVFLKENYKSDKGTRWKVPGSPGGAGGLEYLGENVADYKRRYEIKSKDDEKAWQALIHFCKVLNQTPPDRLEEALKPLCDLDEVLWFLALDVSLNNADGYWVRASDYSIYLDEKGKFHFLPHDMNEAFRPAGGGPGFGPGGGGPGGPGGFGPPRPGDILPPPLQDLLGLTDAQKKQLADLQKDVDTKVEKLLTNEQNQQLRAMRDRGPGGFGPPPGGPGGPGGFGPPGGGGGIELDPLIGLTDTRKPLRSKVLAVPPLRARYLEKVRAVANDLDWKTLGPVVAGFRSLIEKEVQADTRKLASYEAFQRATADTPPAEPRGRDMSLRAFADARRKYLLDYQEPRVALPR